MQYFHQPLITKDEFITEFSQTPTRCLITVRSQTRDNPFIWLTSTHFHFYKNKLSTVPHYPDYCFFLFCCWVFLPYPLNRHFSVLGFSPMVSTIPHKSTNWVVLTQAFGCLLKKNNKFKSSSPLQLHICHDTTIGWPLIISHKTWANWNFYTSF